MLRQVKNFKTMKNIKNAIVALFCFKTYTNMPRLMEIVYGVLAWFCVAIIICAFKS